MQNNKESDDFDFAFKLQQKYYNELIPEEASKESNNSDYVIALKLQKMYDRGFSGDPEDLLSNMDNKSTEPFEHRKEKEYSSKIETKKEKETYSKRETNFFDEYNEPPPYSASHEPHYNSNFSQKSTSTYNNYNNHNNYNNYDNNPFRSSQSMPHAPNQQNALDMQQMQTMVSQMWEMFQHQQNNNNKPDGFRHGNNGYGTHNNYNYNNDFNQSSSRDNINLPGRDPHVYKILLLGGTGTGKSTIINTMTNYFLGGTLDNPKVVIPSKYYRVTEKGFSNKHSEAKLDDVTRSQTTKCRNYEFNHPKNPAYKFIFIDTPGLSDTNGVKQDDKNIQEIINTAISSGSLSAIVIIANGTEARVTPSIRNTLVRLSNNLPDVLVDNNLLLILTKCSISSACFSEDAFAREIAKPKKIFYMDNQAFCTDPKIWKGDEDERLTVQHNWNKSNKTIDQLITEILQLSSTSTKAFEEMKRFRDNIKSELAKVTQDIANIQKVQDSLDAAQKALQQTGDQKKSFANYTTTQNITLKSIVKANYHSTVCTIHFKKDIVCHDNCGLEFKNSSGTNHFQGCYCMGPNHLCKICGCGPASHYHAMVKLETRTQTINKVLEDIKAQYDNANKQHRKYTNDATNYNSALSSLQAAANAKYEHIHKLCHELSKICSRFNFVDELHANIESMKQDARILQNTKLRKNAEMEIQRLEKLANDLSSKRGRTFY